MVLVTPEGKVKVDWSHLQLDHSHLRFRKELKYGRGGGEWWAPEEKIVFQQKYPSW